VVAESARLLLAAHGRISLQQLVSVWLHSWWLIVLLTIAGGSVALLAARIVPKRYDATTMLAVEGDRASSRGAAALGSTIARLGGWAALTGLSQPGTGEARAEAVATLQSEALTERFIVENHLLPVLFADRWDPARQVWLDTDRDHIPSLWEANQLLSKLRVVTENAHTGLVTLTVTWRDPKLAAQWANELVRVTNNYLRNKTIAESERNIVYLRGQAANTDVVEVRGTLSNLLETEFKKEMLARGNEEFALKVIDPAFAPQNASFPKPLLWEACGTLSGLMIGLALAAKRSPAFLLSRS
jgi:uncharacterized protein involved in exopolysaccharide biosynthesis